MMDKKDVPWLWGFDFRTSPGWHDTEALVLHCVSDHCCYKESVEYMSVADMITVLQVHAERNLEEAKWLVSCAKLLNEHGADKILGVISRVESVNSNLREAIRASKIVAGDELRAGTYLADLVVEHGSAEQLVIDMMQSASKTYATLSAEDKVLAETFCEYRNKQLAEAIAEAYSDSVIKKILKESET